jgi:ABC-2 type transport system permease protein
MAVKSFFKFLWALIKTNLSQAYSLKLNFWIETIFMTANNFIMFLTWVILFNKFQSINGWGIGHLILMNAVTMCAYAAYAVFFRGLADTLAGYIERGELDNFILQPRNILINVAGSRCNPSACGDFLSGVIFFAWSGMLLLETIPLALLSIILGFFIFISVAIFIGSLAFYIKDVEGWGQQIMNIFLHLSTQPGSIYIGGMKLFLMFVFPAGMLTFIPVEMITNPTSGGILTAVGITAMFLLFSVCFFYRGLKRYESGNVFGVRS